MVTADRQFSHLSFKLRAIGASERAAAHDALPERRRSLAGRLTLVAISEIDQPYRDKRDAILKHSRGRHITYKYFNL